MQYSEAAAAMNAAGRSVGVIDMASIKPWTRDAVRPRADLALTVEERVTC